MNLSQPIGFSYPTPRHAVRLDSTHLGSSLLDSTQRFLLSEKGPSAMKPPMFKLSADAASLHEELALTPVGGIATYARLSDVIGKPVSGATGALARARIVAQREDGMVFGCIRGEGLKRLDGEGIVDLSGAKTQGVRRHARRVGKTLSMAGFTELREGTQRKAIALASVLMVIADVAKEKSIQAVGHEAAGRVSRLPIKETLRALGLVAKPKEGGRMK